MLTLPYRPIIVSAECLSNQAPGSLLEADWGVKRHADSHRMDLNGAAACRSCAMMREFLVQFLEPTSNSWIPGAMTTPHLGALCSDFSSALFVGHNAIASWRESRIRRLRPVQDVEHGTR
jgi:hypothetical protein